VAKTPDSSDAFHRTRLAVCIGLRWRKLRPRQLRQSPLALGLSALSAVLAAANTVQTLGPAFASALKETGCDAETAWSLAIKRSAIESGATGHRQRLASLRLFVSSRGRPSIRPSKNMLFQAFGMLPAVSMSSYKLATPISQQVAVWSNCTGLTPGEESGFCKRDRVDDQRAIEKQDQQQVGCDAYRNGNRERGEPELDDEVAH
jgi:hypothetical protein